MTRRQSLRAPAPPDAAPFVLRDGAYVLNAPCPHCAATDGWTCYPGKWPKCWRCGVTVLTYGRTPEAECVTPNGRVDGHGGYVRLAGGTTVCAFCRQSLEELPRKDGKR